MNHYQRGQALRLILVFLGLVLALKGCFAGTRISNPEPNGDTNSSYQSDDSSSGWSNDSQDSEDSGWNFGGSDNSDWDSGGGGWDSGGGDSGSWDSGGGDSGSW